MKSFLKSYIFKKSKFSTEGRLGKDHTVITAGCNSEGLKKPAVSEILNTMVLMEKHHGGTLWTNHSPPLQYINFSKEHQDETEMCSVAFGVLHINTDPFSREAWCWVHHGLDLFHPAFQWML